MIPSDIPQWIVLSWLFVLGSVVGSFLNVCIYRIPKHDRLWDQLSGLTSPPSTCPFCRTRILAIDNIPILGWLFLGGRCRFCRHSIPPRYALIEFLNGALWVVLYIAIVPEGFTAKTSDSCLWSYLSPLNSTRLSNSQLVFQFNAMYFYYLIMAEALLVATFIDIDLQIIPDGSTVPAMVMGILGSFLIGNLHPWPVWFQNLPKAQLISGMFPNWFAMLTESSSTLVWASHHPHLHGLISSVLGMVVGGGVVWLLRVVGHWAWQREVMGMGDVVLMMMVGSFLGWQPTILVFCVAPFCGLLVTVLTFRLMKTNELAYGPYLSLAAMLVMLGWKSYFSRYSEVFDFGPMVIIVGLMMFIPMAVILVAVRRIKMLLGFSDFELYSEKEVWESGDQLAFYANKNDDTNSRPHTDQTSSVHSGWQIANWPGYAAGQGRQFADKWKTGQK